MVFGWRRKKYDDVALGLGLAQEIGRSRDGRYPRTVPSRYNDFLPPAPEQVEIFRTATLF